MLVLFDNGTPRTLARYLIDRHAVTETRARGWDELENGALLNAAEAAGFEVLVTMDKNLKYQQNLSERKIAVVVLGRGRWSLIKAHVAEVVAEVVAAVDAATAGRYVEVDIPAA
jgi:rRNA-processing protein FCF1